MSEYVSDLGDDPPAATIESIAAQTTEILALQRAEDSRRKWTFVFTVAGALFAAVKLGWIAIPHIRARRKLGQLAPATNPHRRHHRH